MKKLAQILLALLLLACSSSQKSHTETAQAVVESFYKKDLITLKNNTTPESYEAFVAIHDFVVPTAMTGASNFKVLEQIDNGEIAWVKFTTSYNEDPETFKLVRVDGKWLVTEKGLREEMPF